ncbi:hypothetical protein BN424_3188 [Carnobacterium maltaromaticum LMA28]|uniref:Uncharacterized protein n=1 Tax=Carnobacterium maltaromaticum LMA28 TaxID=1234679 RepID=K8E6Y5_CARML|nr:hypothetical protein IV70_GL002327 [Carnobacterium maltaromaticum DSM 20342]KRN72178.1 hypothetical protein IV76_GL002876 [Carnobacterium maltaromaticum]CCO12609.2 hypothetical protein BN424_3188 [Carnobacterium maltaromaticum LMA28]
MSQSFGKKINSQKSKEQLFLEFAIFLPGLNGLKELFIKASSFEPVLRKKDKFPKK